MHMAVFMYITFTCITLIVHFPVFYLYLSTFFLFKDLHAVSTISPRCLSLSCGGFLCSLKRINKFIVIKGSAV